jgi:hypothetical protein
MTFCAAACNRASACATLQDAGVVNVTTCTSNCVATNAGEPTLYRADFWSANTSCITTASCADTISGAATPNCSETALSGIVPDPMAVAFCTIVENQFVDGGGCITPNSCLATYKILSDPPIEALEACVLSATFCTDPDAGMACVDRAVMP